MAFLELEGIAKYFGRTTAVDHISLSIKQGEFLTLLGPSGCGKTTILRMVAGFEIPDEGNILLDGEDFPKWAAVIRTSSPVVNSSVLPWHVR
jgi:ABC-type Fe3+/spermidine/putrescine transport system ATPase subunit